MNLAHMRFKCLDTEEAIEKSILKTSESPSNARTAAMNGPTQAKKLFMIT